MFFHLFKYAIMLQLNSLSKSAYFITDFSQDMQSIQLPLCVTYMSVQPHLVTHRRARTHTLRICFPSILKHKDWLCFHVEFSSLLRCLWFNYDLNLVECIHHESRLQSKVFWFDPFVKLFLLTMNSVNPSCHLKLTWTDL